MRGFAVLESAIQLEVDGGLGIVSALSLGRTGQLYVSFLSCVTALVRLWSYQTPKIWLILGLGKYIQLHSTSQIKQPPHTATKSLPLHKSMITA
jgi:hypothetical protein